MIGRLGPAELFVILAIVFFLFGAKRLPEIGKGIGDGIRQFKDAMNHDKRDQEEKEKG
jgi:sec-independent protein translocase protein TatA